MHKDVIPLWRGRYARLLRLYPKPVHARFGEAMEQTFVDLCRANKPSLRFLLWLFAETFAAIVVEHVRGFMMQNKSTLRVAGLAGLLLLIPLVAMQFTAEVNWSPFDFIAAFVLLFGAGLIYEAIKRKARSPSYRVATGLAVASGLFLVWSNLAVGLIGSEDNPANVMYFAVLAVGFIGGILARFEPVGMMRVLFAMALTQAAVSVIAVAIWKLPPSSDAMEVIGVNAFFITLFVGAALLFRNAARES